jgi:hypothetical protein
MRSVLLAFRRDGANSSNAGAIFTIKPFEGAPPTA